MGLTGPAGPTGPTGPAGPIVQGSVLMLSAVGGVPAPPAGYAFAGEVVALKNGALVPYALFVKK